MAKFKGMVTDAVTEAEDLMWSGLMWCQHEDRFDIDLDALQDDVTFAKRGYSFVDRLDNKLDGGLDWMLARMVATAKGRELRQDMHWRRHNVRAYLKAVEQFKRLLLFVVHVTGGQPARGPEVLGLRFRNGFLQDRNIFVISGQVVAVTRYHKSQSQWDVPKVIPRFLAVAGRSATVGVHLLPPALCRTAVGRCHGPLLDRPPLVRRQRLLGDGQAERDHRGPDGEEVGCASDNTRLPARRCRHREEESRRCIRTRLPGRDWRGGGRGAGARGRSGLGDIGGPDDEDRRAGVRCVEQCGQAPQS